MRHLLRPLTLWVQYLPQLLACYLLGYLGRHAAIELAAWAGYDNDFWAAAIMPLAGMARLASYVGMFLVLRPALPVLSTFSSRNLREVNIFATIIVPFFAIYLAWQMFREDWLAFEARALIRRVDASMTAALNSPETPTEVVPGSLPVGTSTMVLIGAALVLRYALSWAKDRLPTWMVAVRVYVDALWVFLVLSYSVNEGLTLLINPGRWLSERRIVVWFNTTREQLFSHFSLLEHAWDTVMWAIRTVFGGAAVPLIWLAVAGIVYGVTAKVDWRDAARAVAGARVTTVIDRAAPVRQRVSGRLRAVPKAVREKARDHAVGRLGKFRPIVDSLRLILHGGVLALSLYVLAYLGLAWLDMSGSFYRAQIGDGYLFRGVAWLVGPQPWLFWSDLGDTLSLVLHALIEPLRICLVASTFAYCLERVRAQPSPGLSPAAAPTPQD